MKRLIQYGDLCDSFWKEAKEIDKKRFLQIKSSFELEFSQQMHSFGSNSNNTAILDNVKKTLIHNSRLKNLIRKTLQRKFIQLKLYLTKKTI